MDTLPLLAQTLRSGQRPLLDYLDELEAHFNEREPELLAFVEEDGRFPRLRREAQQLLQQYPDPQSRPPLFGIPLGVKDIFHAAGFITRAGSRLPPEVIQGNEAGSVTHLRRAGALLLGKTGTTEFAYFAPGPTRNPHNPGHTPGGSSSGSAAAVAAGLCPLAVGTQTIGSINRPAAFCGVVGYKPSYDRISRSGVIPLAESVDHIGLFATTVAGVALAAGLLCREWRVESGEWDLRGDLLSNLHSPLSPTLGIPEGPYLERTSGEGLAHFRQTVARLKAAGLTVKPVAALTDFEAIYTRHNLLVAAEAARVHAIWFKQFGELYHWKTAELIQRGQGVSNEELAEARNGCLQLRQELTTLMAEHDLDLWLSPPALGAAPAGLDSTGDPVMNLPWTHAGLPTLTIPAGFNTAGLPLGLQLTGRWFEDEALMGQGRLLEKILQGD
jgi:Asp-tRNA(Asn)/Glu-tRNA(Gln) amidotransferase A subunit family amidase